MKNTLTSSINAFAVGLICLIIFIVLRPIASPSVTASPELSESVRANFDKDVSEVLAGNQKMQLEMLADQKKLLQKIDANVSKLVGNPTSSLPKLDEEPSSAAVEVTSPIITSRGIFRRGSVIRQPISGAGR